MVTVTRFDSNSVTVTMINTANQLILGALLDALDWDDGESALARM